MKKGINVGVDTGTRDGKREWDSINESWRAVSEGFNSDAKLADVWFPGPNRGVMIMPVVQEFWRQMSEIP